MSPLEVCQFEFRCRHLPSVVAFARGGLGWHMTPVGDDYALANPGRPPVIGLMQAAHEDVPIGARYAAATYNSARTSVDKASETLSAGYDVALTRVSGALNRLSNFAGW